MGESDPAKKDVLGSDILDFNPRGSYPGNCAPGAWPVTTAGVTVDPCQWFQLTGKADDTAAPETLVNNQHHHGTDWIYGGWDRDVLQADRAQNGPNPGDRLIDWNGAYNLFSHCNAAYGGFNDVRQHSPAMQNFLKSLAWGSGAGQARGGREHGRYVGVPGAGADLQPGSRARHGERLPGHAGSLRRPGGLLGLIDGRAV